MASYRRRGKTWTYYVSYKKPDGKRGQKSNGGYSTKKAAQLAAIEVEQLYSHGADLAMRDVGFVEYWDKWIKLYKADKHSQITEARYSTLRKHLLQYFGPDRTLKSVTKSDWQEFLNKYGAHRSKDAVSRLNGYVRSMCRNAIDDQIIYSNFTTGAVLSGRRPKDRSLKFLEIPALKKLYAHCVAHASLGTMYNYVIATGILTGARFAEIMGLQWQDVDFERATININKTWDYTYKTGFMPTKTPASVRVIDISPDLVALLKQLRAEQAAYYMKQGYRDDKDLVFRNKLHQVMGDSAANKALHQLEDQLNIKPRITFHGLRHSHVSYLLARGVDINYISHRLGHSDITVTLRVYAHLLKQTERQQVQATIRALQAL